MPFMDQKREYPNARAATPEHWNCVDCGHNTAPGIAPRALAEWDIWQHDESEVYMVRPEIWKRAAMGDWGGCLCIGCLERRIGRRLRPKDFDRDHPFNQFPGSTRLLNRRDGVIEGPPLG